MKQTFLAILLMLLPMLASADAVEIDGIWYNLVAKAKEAEVTKNPNKYSGDVIIPPSVTYNGQPYSVTSIGGSAFRSCYDLTSVTISNSVTSIGEYAFAYCGLTSVTIPNSVTTIGNYAFEYCSGLTSVTIGNSVTSIGGYAFYNCSGLTSVTIPNSVTSIGGGAFYGCSGLTSVTIPNSVASIGNHAFSGCSSLTSVTIPNSVISIGDFAFYCCSNLTSITIPNSVTSIGVCAFSGCSSLTSVTIPSSVTSMGHNVFGNCNSLASIVVDSKNTMFDSRDNCNAIIYKMNNTLVAGCKNTIIPNSVTKIGISAFYECRNLTSITIPNSVTSIQLDAFYGCSGLTSITIPNSVTSIGSNAFYGTGWYNNQDNGILYLDNWLIGYKGEKPTGMIVFTKGTKGIVDEAFWGCSGLTSITIPNSVTSIGSNAFYDCSGLTSITIPNSVTRIGEYALIYCSGLTSITIPNSVTSIGSCAFYGCSGLTSVVSLNNEPLRCDDLDLFYEVDKNSCVLWVPKGSLAAYKNADDWKDFQNIKELVHGDVNLDSEVNHGDLNAIVDYVMGKDPIDFYESLGDLNGDDMVDAADVVLQVDAIMKADEYSKNKAPANVEAVDLGLPKGTKWANMNVGAESPEDCGLYFAWGETAGYTSDTSDGRLFNWASYKWMNKGQSVGSQVNKYQIADGHTADCWYNSEAKFIGDGKTKLDLEDDAAYVNWGADWCMPTSLDFQELFDNTTYEWTTLNDIYGLRFTSKTNGNSIFLPAAGDRVNSGFYDLSTDGCYWSSSLHVFDSSSASFLIFNWISNNPISMASRSCGLTVRPVLRINP